MEGGDESLSCEQRGCSDRTHPSYAAVCAGGFEGLSIGRSCLADGLPAVGSNWQITEHQKQYIAGHLLHARGEQYHKYGYLRQQQRDHDTLPNEPTSATGSRMHKRSFVEQVHLLQADGIDSNLAEDCRIYR